jgi:hypothetical protein
MIGDDRLKVMKTRIEEANPFSSFREKVFDFIVTPKGSPYHGMDLEQLNRFTKRQWANFQRNFASASI